MILFLFWIFGYAKSDKNYLEKVLKTKNNEFINVRERKKYIFGFTW